MSERTETLNAPGARRQRAPVAGLVAVFTGASARLPPPAALARALSVGRGDDADVAVDDPKVSRAHTRVVVTRGAIEVSDLGSRNGTFVDGVRVEARPLPARHGSVLRVGNTLFVVVADVAPHLAAGEDAGALVGGGALVAVRRAIAEAAALRGHALVLGETGTGKELVAGAIHAASGRRGPLVPVNCAALPDDLVESELFGHARGAFSGAERARAGLFRAADGGTLFLDEVGELAPAAQARLLRALETGEVRAVGDDRPALADVRVVAATHRDLDAMVTRGAFRADLLYRLATARVCLPPLRERREDIPALAERFLAAAGRRPSVDAMERLLRAPWPGNVRELRNALGVAAARAAARGATAFDPGDLPPLDAPPAPRAADADADADAALRARAEAALAKHQGNVTRAARELGLRRARLYEHLKRLGLDPARHRPPR